MTGALRRTIRFGLATLVTTALLVASGAPSVLAGSASNPEIIDAADDVSPVAFASNESIDSAIFTQAGSYDVVKAWVALESVDDFWVFVEVKDLPDGWGLPTDPPDETPFGHNATFAGTSLVANFSVAGQTYRAIFKIDMPEVGVIMDNYTLWRDSDGFGGAVSGTYNTTQDWMAMKLPKEAFVGLADNVHLTDFWVLGRFGNHSMDFAPNAQDSSGVTDPLVLAQRLAEGKVVTPRYGLDYVFGRYYRPPPPGQAPDPGVVAPDILLHISGASQRMIAPGGTTSYELIVTNDASGTDTVYLVLNSAAEGWSHQLSESQVVLDPQESRIVLLTVSASEGATDPMRSVVDLSSTLGARESASVFTVLQLKADSSNGPSDPPPSGGPEASEQGDSPGFGFTLALAAVGTLIVARRRR